MGWLMDTYAGTPIEATLVYFFAYIGSAGTIYFAFGSFLTGIGVDRLWITRRGRGRTTELKGLSWMAVSFAISVFLSILSGPTTMLFFAIFCWVGWIAFQGYRALVAFDDPVADGQSQAHGFADLFGGKKGFKDFFLVLCGQSDAVVIKTNLHLDRFVVNYPKWALHIGFQVKVPGDFEGLLCHVHHLDSI